MLLPCLACGRMGAATVVAVMGLYEEHICVYGSCERGNHRYELPSYLVNRMADARCAARNSATVLQTGPTKAWEKTKKDSAAKAAPHVALLAARRIGVLVLSHTRQQTVSSTLIRNVCVCWLDAAHTANTTVCCASASRLCVASVRTHSTQGRAHPQIKGTESHCHHPSCTCTRTHSSHLHRLCAGMHATRQPLEMPLLLLSQQRVLLSTLVTRPQ